MQGTYYWQTIRRILLPFGVLEYQSSPSNMASNKQGHEDK